MAPELDSTQPAHRKEDLIGRKVNHLTVVKYGGVSYSPSGMSRSFWWCQCDCGNPKLVLAVTARLNSGAAKSCGCSSPRGRRCRHGHSRRGNVHRLYQTWVTMRKRCLSPGYIGYKYWGGRGIKISPRWDTFELFLADMGATWQEGLTLNRIDNDGDYSPENCRWATPREQCNNRSNNRHVPGFGRTQTAVEWARELKMGKTTFLYRLNKGMTVEQIAAVSIRPYVKAISS